MPLQQILPTWLALNGCNDASPSGMVNIRTGEPVFAGGLNLGDYFDLTEKEANGASYTQTGILHSGRFRRVQVHAGATAANVKAGTLGVMVAALIPEVNIVTSFDAGVANMRVVVFLNVVTPGNFCFVQELGIANVLAAAALTGAATVGAQVIATANGTVDSGGTTTASVSPLGKFLDVPVINTVVRALLNLPDIQG
jgi:hypothetical protein